MATTIDRTLAEITRLRDALLSIERELTAMHVRTSLHIAKTTLARDFVADLRQETP